MSGPWHPTSRAKVNSRRPAAQGVCDRCARSYQLSELRQQPFYAGFNIQLNNFLVCKECLDIPNPQLKALVIPPDPIPVLNPRPEPYAVEVPNFVATEQPFMQGDDITTEADDDLITEIQDTPLPDPNNPAQYP